MTLTPKLLVEALISACLLTGSVTAQTPTQVPAAHPPDARSNSRARGAERTRNFLGLGTPPDAPAAEQGSKIFSATCAFCHGAKATGGDTGPDLVRSTLVLHDEKADLIGPLVHNGRIARGMPSFPAFTDAELYDIAEFLHMRVELTANRGTYKLLDVVSGDAKAGEAYFEGTSGCSGCHSVTGDLAHIGSKLSPADLQQTFLYPAARAPVSGSETAAQKVRITLSSGERLTGTLKHIDDFNVSFYDERGDYRSVAVVPGIRVDVEDKLARHRQLLDQYTDSDMHNLTAYLVTLK